MYNFVPSSNNRRWQPPMFTGLPTQWRRPLNYNYMLSGWPTPGQGFYGGPSMSGGGFYGGQSYHGHGGPPPATSFRVSGWPTPGQGFYGGPSMSGPSGGGFYGGQSYHGGPPATPFYSGQPGTSFYGGPPSYSTPPAPVHQGMAPNHPQHPPNQYQPPNSGPIRQHKKWDRKAVQPHPYHLEPESLGAVYYDRSTGVLRTRSPNDANKNTRIGKVWEPRQKNPFMADCNFT